MTDSRGQKFGQGLKMEKFLNIHPLITLARFEMNWMKTLSVNVRKPQIWPILVAHHGAKYLATGPKIKSFLKTHQVSTHARFEVNWTETFWDHECSETIVWINVYTDQRTDRRKPNVPIRLCLWGQKLKAFYYRPYTGESPAGDQLIPVTKGQ